MFSTNFLSEFVYCILNCYAHMNILQMEYAHYKCKLLLLLLLRSLKDMCGVENDKIGTHKETSVFLVSSERRRMSNGLFHVLQLA